MKLQDMLAVVCGQRGVDMADVLIEVCYENSFDANEIDSFDDMCDYLGVSFKNSSELEEWLSQNNYI